jgi:hypothetical protein
VVVVGGVWGGGGGGGGPPAGLGASPLKLTACSPELLGRDLFFGLTPLVRTFLRICCVLVWLTNVVSTAASLSLTWPTLLTHTVRPVFRSHLPGAPCGSS